jgi:hypothetical protein
VAKRVRGSTTRRRSSGSAPRGAPSSPAGPVADVNPEAASVTAAGPEGAGTSLAATALRQPAAGAATTSTATSLRRVGRRTRPRADDLTSRATAEDAWVRADLRRIAIISTGLVGILVVLWLLLVVLDVFGLY